MLLYLLYRLGFGEILISNRGQHTFSINGEIVSILGFVGHVVCVATVHLDLCNGKAAIEINKTNVCGSLPVELYLQINDCGLDLAHGL